MSVSRHGLLDTVKKDMGVASDPALRPPLSRRYGLEDSFWTNVWPF